MKDTKNIIVRAEAGSHFGYTVARYKLVRNRLKLIEIGDENTGLVGNNIVNQLDELTIEEAEEMLKDEVELIRDRYDNDSVSHATLFNAKLILEC